MHPRVVITGLGLVSPLGDDKDEFWNNLIHGRCHISELHGQIYDGMRSKKVYAVENIANASGESKAFLFARQAIASAIEDAVLEPKQVEDSGMMMASADGCIDMLETGIYERYPLGYMLDELIKAFGIKGPSLSISTACASGNAAIANAYDMIKDGSVERIIVGGTEVLSPTILSGFNALRAVTQDICAPFDKDREGMVVSEGAAFLVLETQEAARKRGAHVYCEVAGYGLSCDGYNMTNPNGIGLSIAIDKAMRNGNIYLEQVDYINAHGTGTPANDAAEAFAISRALGLYAGRPAISSTKATHGHMLGASGAIEAVVCALAIDRDIIPPTGGCKNKEFQELDIVIGEYRKKPIECAISDSQAFGGANAVVAFRKMYDNHEP